MDSGTIAAIATGTGNAGIGVIRVSGKEAWDIVQKVFYNRTNKSICFASFNSHTAHVGFIHDGAEMIDEVLVLLMKGPHSYTGEDTVEISCHGGTFVIKRVLETVIKNGARLAEPGEFSKRAFLNGRLDLSEAEAVMDIIHSRNECALKSSVRQIRGELREKVEKMRKKILYHTAYIEAALDDPEHISLDGYGDTLQKESVGMVKEIDGLIKASENGRLLRDGIRTVIVGKPNVGKSSLLNTMTGIDRAIVTDIPGTTRDTVEEQINLNGIMIDLIDTAGIREADDPVEKIGVTRAINTAKDSDLVLYMMDSSQPIDGNDKQIIEQLKDRKVIVLLNKSDLKAVVDINTARDFLHDNQKDKKNENTWQVIEVSMREHTGIDQLEKAVCDLFFQGSIERCGDDIIAGIRQKEALADAKASLLQVIESIKERMPEDFYSIDLMDAMNALGMITGESAGEELINEIFSKFCLGK